MKRAFTLWSLLVGIQAYAQAPDHFSESSAQWFVCNQFAAGTPQDPSFVGMDTRIFFFSGDSLIGGDTWLKLYASENENLSAPLFQGCIRSQGNYVFHRDAAGMLDTLYNFGLQAGDSVYFDFGLANDYVPVTSVDSVQVNGNWHRRIRFGEPNPVMGFSVFGEEWIAGIGSIHGLLFPQAPRLFETELPDRSDLACSVYSASLYWHMPSYAQCYNSRVFAMAESPRPDLLKLYPNPATDLLYIAMPPDTETPVPGRIYLYNSLGSMIYSTPFQGGKQALDLHRLSPGMYRLVIGGAGSRYGGTFIKK